MPTCTPVLREFLIGKRSDSGKWEWKDGLERSDVSWLFPAVPTKRSGQMRGNARVYRHGSRESPRVEPTSVGLVMNV
jgi:hypothetical protein